MVYVDPKNLGYEPYWLRWVGKRTNVVEREELIRLFQKYVPGSIDLICNGLRDGKPTEKLKTIVPFTNLNMARRLAVLYQYFVMPDLQISLPDVLWSSSLIL